VSAGLNKTPFSPFSLRYMGASRGALNQLHLWARRGSNP